jgi:16S rRNA processing protein RimM
MGRVAAPYAVKGWIKVQPFTEYLDSLLDYPVWHLGRAGRWQPYQVLEAKVHGKHLVASLEAVADRNAAQALAGMEVAVPRDEMPEADEGEYYWDELVGLEVINLAGEDLGRVEGLLETGAHDVLQVAGERQRLIPFTAPILVEVDLESGRIVVDWGSDY